MVRRFELLFVLGIYGLARLSIASAEAPPQADRFHLTDKLQEKIISERRQLIKELLGTLLDNRTTCTAKASLFSLARKQDGLELIQEIERTINVLGAIRATEASEGLARYVEFFNPQKLKGSNRIRPVGEIFPSINALKEIGPPVIDPVLSIVGQEPLSQQALFNFATVLVAVECNSCLVEHIDRALVMYKKEDQLRVLKEKVLQLRVNEPTK